MLKRKFMNRLIQWKMRHRDECLLIKGARQIGKTFLVREFGREQYQSVIEINFEEHPSWKEIFQGDLDAESIKRRISLFIPGVRFIPGHTLLFLDEIQSCPEARTALKFLAMDHSMDTVATGSLLGINYREISSFPVGYERQETMYSLDFEEFLWASGFPESVMSDMRPFFENKEKVPPAINGQMMKLLREYMVVGGMPSVCNCFIDTDNYGEVDREQRKILATYLNDMEKYASVPEKPKVRDCYLSIPRQLARENKKFKYSLVEKGGSARKFGNSLSWLRDAGLVDFCYNLSTPSFPLAAYVKEDQFKIYGSDIGLLTAMYGFDMKKAVVDDTLLGPMKGGIYENLVSDMLTKREIPLVYYSVPDNTQEIEFLISRDAQIIPVEVKSKNGSSVSLNHLLERKDIPFGYKLISGNVGVAGKKITLPLYMAMFI